MVAVHYDRALEPELGQSWEGGVKVQPYTGLTLAAAGFYIVKENATEYLPDPDDVDPDRDPGRQTAEPGHENSRRSAS